MNLISAGVALATAVAAVGLASPTQAADVPTGSVDIMTAEATAYGPWAQNPPDPPYVSKPTFPTRMLVTCPAGRQAQVDMSPVWSMTIPGIAFTCAGEPQEVVFVPTSSQSTDEGWHVTTVSATLVLRPVEEGGPLTTLDTDVRQVRVNTVGTGEKPPVPHPTPPPRPGPVAHRPSVPRAVHTRSASRRATLVWARPAHTGGARIDRYQVRKGRSAPHNVRVTSRRFTFTRLANGRSYRLFVRAHNRAGFSRWVAAVARPHARSRPRPPAHRPRPRPRDYPNCTALHRVYPHGVGRPGAVDHTHGDPVRNFTRSRVVYRLNTESDRDRDGIACEKH